jgi:hypothetical protein
MSTITDRYNTARKDVDKWLHESYPDADWDTIDELGRAAAWELYAGPMGADYWTECDPLKVKWPGWVAACKALSEAIESLPGEVYYDDDFGGVIGETDPWNDPANWEDDHEYEGERRYYGPNEYYAVRTIEALFDKELWRYIT